MDDSICVVIEISDNNLEGGELCLMELGLVVNLHCGDAIIFKLSEISHFNLHYKGQRVSLVFLSDKMASSWLRIEMVGTTIFT